MNQTRTAQDVDRDHELFDELPMDEKFLYCTGLAKRSAMAFESLLSSGGPNRARHVAILRTKAEEISILADTWLHVDSGIDPAPGE